MPNTVIHASAALRAALLALALLATALPGMALAQDQSGPYVRGGGGFDWSRDTRLRDDNCASTQPPALFGCGAGVDGSSLGARGNFGRNDVVDGALGYRISPQWRVEALMSYRTRVDFSGNANFLNVAGDQPVSARGNALSGFAVGYYDLPLIGRVQPFVGAGLGTTRNRTGGMQFLFPGLGPEAATLTSSGRLTDFSYLVTAGAAVSLRDGLTLDFAYRYSDLGDMRTERGPAAIIRGPSNNLLDIGGTKASLEAHGITVNLRFDF